jgi:hypothetical protein
MSKLNNTGTCLLCKERMDHRSIIKHISQCLEKSESAPEKNKPSEKEKIFLIKVFAGKSFWLYVEINGSSILDHLDSFLRETWLECCDHMSQFSIDGKDYSSGGEMNKLINKLLNVGTKFDYEYDFGTTTELEGKVISTRPGKLKKSVRLIARNDLPEDISCTSCQNKPTVICPVCYDFCCKKCQKKHDSCEGEEFMLPVVNSPRMGMCGYVGEES